MCLKFSRELVDHRIRGNLGQKENEKKKSDQILECVNQRNKDSAAHEIFVLSRCPLRASRRLNVRMQPPIPFMLLKLVSGSIRLDAIMFGVFDTDAFAPVARRMIAILRTKIGLEVTFKVGNFLVGLFPTTLGTN
jgi:hypothetical protein